MYIISKYDNIIILTAKLKRSWRTVQLPEGIVRQIEAYIKTKDAEKRGLNTISGFVVFTLRKELEGKG